MSDPDKFITLFLCLEVKKVVLYLSSFFSVLNICESHCEIVIFNKWIGNFFQKTIDVSSLGILEIVFLSGT